MNQNCAKELARRKKWQPIDTDRFSRIRKHGETKIGISKRPLRDKSAQSAISVCCLFRITDPALRGSFSEVQLR
jgi:hypothetical protein